MASRCFRNRVFAPLSLAVASLLLSCSQTAGEPCQVDGDCDDGLVCDKTTSALTARGVCCASRGGCIGAVDSGPRPDTGPRDVDTGPDEEDMGADEEDMGADEQDTGPRDSGPRDTGPNDTGPLDTGPVDSGPADTGPAQPDASSEDAGSEGDASDVDGG